MELEPTEEFPQQQQSNEPQARRGACSFVYKEQFNVYSGCLPEVQPFNQTPDIRLEVLDLGLGEWSTVETTVIRSLPNNISGACCVVVNDSLYLFGGWLAGLRSASVHQLDLSKRVWRELPARNHQDGPFNKDKAGMFVYGSDMVGVFGGYGYPDNQTGQRDATYGWDPSSPLHICWTNELHLFHIEKLEWISPVMTGVRPPPCAAFSLTQIDSHRLVLFGGKQITQRVNEVHILDMANWHWSGAILPSRPEEPWPIGRSFHTACSLVDPSLVHHNCLTIKAFDWLPCSPPDLSPLEDCWHGDPKLLVLWGMDNNADPINDAWELNVNTLIWKEVSLPAHTGRGRAWHCASVHHPSPGEAVVVAFGGTNKNLFRTPEIHLPSVAMTTILYCGVRSLLKLCMDVITQEDLSTQPKQLPLYIQQILQKQTETVQKLKQFKVARL